MQPFPIVWIILTKLHIKRIFEPRNRGERESVKLPMRHLAGWNATRVLCAVIRTHCTKTDRLPFYNTQHLPSLTMECFL